jgi:chromosome segregation ATPase
LSSQLENIAPQLASLEKALSESRTKLKEEQKLRRHAEQAQDELEAKYREAEGSLNALRDECDAVHEELAFKESELEETRLELEVEKERSRVELEDARADAAITSTFDKEKDESVMTDQVVQSSPRAAASAAADSSFPTVDDAYVKKLEDELELVTEQLIETEQRLSQTEEQLATTQTSSSKSQEAADKKKADAGEENHKDKELITVLQEENAARLEDEHKLREELELTREELTLTQEELRAIEFDSKEVQNKLANIRAEHREEMKKVQSEGGDVGVFADSLTLATEEIAKLKDEVDNLNAALVNSKEDHEAVVEELEAVNQRFDESREEAEKRGRDIGGADIRAEMKAEREEDMKELREQLKKLAEENAALQSKVDDAEMSLAVAKDSQTRNSEGVEVQSELVKQLQSQLGRAKEDLVKKEKEMAVLASSLEARVTKAEENVTKLEQELSTTKGKLAEAEAHLIVSRREKEVAESTSLTKHKPASRSDEGSSRTYRSAMSSDNPELQNMDEEQKITRKRRTRSSSPNSFKRLELRLSEEIKKLHELHGDCDKLKDQKRMVEVHVKRLEEDIKVLQRQLFASGEAGVSTSMSRLSSMASKRGGEIDMDAKSKVDEVIESGDLGLMKAELMTLDKKCNAQRDYNNQLLSKMLSLQGNIQVFCRIRPKAVDEVQRGYKTVIENLSETELGCFDHRTNQWKSFAFDKVWGPDQTQQSIFQDIEPLALSVVDGFNACIFAYGQT